jgi:hypothetical protein
MISSERSMPVRADAPLALEREPLLARTTRQMLRFPRIKKRPIWRSPRRPGRSRV